MFVTIGKKFVRIRVVRGSGWNLGKASHFNRPYSNEFESNSTKVSGISHQFHPQYKMHIILQVDLFGTNFWSRKSAFGRCNFQTN